MEKFMVLSNASQAFAVVNCDGKVTQLEPLMFYNMNQMVGVLYHIHPKTLS